MKRRTLPDPMAEHWRRTDGLIERFTTARTFEEAVGGASVEGGGAYVCFACRVRFTCYLSAVHGCRVIECPRCGQTGEST